MRAISQERGFTIVEVMVAVVILLTGALGTMAMLDTANHRSRTAADRQKATAVAREVLEVAKSLPYREIAPGTLVAELREDEGIGGLVGSPWRIERDGTVFTVEASVCSLDEPADGSGSHAAGGFCTASGPAGVGDSNPVDYKRVTVAVSWTNGSGKGSARQSTMITHRSGVDAPAVTSVRLASPSSSPITSPSTQSASFAATTAANAITVVWAVDGEQQGVAAGTGRNWTFSWPLPEYDGAYDVSARALDASGLGGETRSITVVVNRFPALAPANFAAGRNGDVVEVEWSRNAERDVIGYRVYRQGATGQAVLVCEVVAKAGCVDAAPPARTGTALDYWAVAIDRDPDGAEREGTATARVNVNVANVAPPPPTALTLSKDAQGRTVLRWNASPAGDPDAGDYVAWYRIYRDGTSIGDRYDRVAGTATMAIDAQGGTHDYWITAVDSHLQESTLLGPVRG